MVIDLAIQIKDEIKHLIAKNAELTEQVSTLTEQRDRWHSNWTERNAEYDELLDYYDELKAERDELTNQLESAHAKNRALKAHITKMQEGRHGWHIKGKELQQQVDSLKRKLEAAQDVNERQDLEYISLVHEIGTLRAERDRYRELCGKLLDAADEMRRVRDAFDQFERGEA